MAPKKRGSRTQKEILYEREKCLKIIKYIGRAQIPLILINGAFIVFSVLRLIPEFPFSYKSTAEHRPSEMTIWLGACLTLAINLMAMITYVLGVILGRAELIYGYVFVNGAWILVFAAMTAVVSNSDKTGIYAIITLAALGYLFLNVLVDIIVYYLLASLRKWSHSVSISSKASTNILSKTDNIIQSPLHIGVGHQKTTTDASVTEFTLRFQESVHNK